MSCAIWCETSLISSGYILNIMYISTVYVVCVTSQGLLSLYSYKREKTVWTSAIVYISIKFKNSIQKGM